MELQNVVDAIQRLEDRVIEMISKQSEHNTILKTHEQRSLALQKSQDGLDLRMKPVEEHVKFINWFLKLCGMILVGFCAEALVKYYFN